MVLVGDAFCGVVFNSVVYMAVHLTVCLRLLALIVWLAVDLWCVYC